MAQPRVSSSPSAAMEGSPYDDPLFREMSPSCWSKRFHDREKLIEHFTRFVAEGSKRATENLKHKLDIPYGDGENEKYDVFGTDLPNDAPLLVYVHGGYWRAFSRQESRYFAESFHESGVKTAVVGYDLCPKVTIAHIVDQIKRATVSIFDYAAENNSRGVYLIGHSAGAQLVAKVLSDESLLNSIENVDVFKGAFLVSGVYDLTHLVRTPENDCLKLTAEEARRMSPQFDKYFHLYNRNIRIYVLVAEHDSRTYVQMSRIMYDMLMESCQVYNVNFRILDGYDHFDIMETLSKSENYLKKLLLDDMNNHR